MLALSRVSYRYAGYAARVLHDIDLTLADGEIVGVVGGNDAGKSTLASLRPASRRGPSAAASPGGWPSTAST
jgi:ABC-type multidrug transport system fused ATPase/permease subunit